MEYGSTIDTWQTEQQVGDSTQTVDMFQYGRVALVWITTDDRSGARWDRQQGAWVPLESSMIPHVREAIRVADGKKQQEVLFGPVTRLSVQ
jgi:hypothetical protein